MVGNIKDGGGVEDFSTDLGGREEVEEEEHAGEAEHVRLLGTALRVAEVVVHVQRQQEHGRANQVLI